MRLVLWDLTAVGIGALLILMGAAQITALLVAVALGVLAALSSFTRKADDDLLTWLQGKVEQRSAVLRAEYEAAVAERNQRFIEALRQQAHDYDHLLQHERERAEDVVTLAVVTLIRPTPPYISKN